MRTRDRPLGVTMLAMLWFVMAALNVFLGAGVLLGGGAFLQFYEGAVGAVAGGVLTALGVAILLVGLVQLAVGWGLARLEPWAWTAAVVVAVLGLLNFPVGTLLGVIVLVYLAQPEVREAFLAKRHAVARV